MQELIQENTKNTYDWENNESRQGNIMKNHRKYKKYVLISSNFNGGDSVNEKEINNKYYQNTLTLSEKRKNDNFLLKTPNSKLASEAIKVKRRFKKVLVKKEKRAQIKSEDSSKK